MATTTYLSQPGVLTVATVDLRDQASAISFTLGNEPLTSTAFGDTGQRMVGGLQTVEGTITLYMSYGAAEVEATIFGEVGQGDTTIVVKKDDAVGCCRQSRVDYLEHHDCQLPHHLHGGRASGHGSELRGRLIRARHHAVTTSKGEQWLQQ
jgi:hypothetical protein